MTVANSFDPADFVAIRSDLEAFLSKQVGPLRVVEGPTRFTGGMDTYVYSLRLTGENPKEWLGPLVLRVYPTPEQATKAQREAAIQRFASDRGIAAPRPLLIETGGEPFGLPFMIMERAPGTPLIDRFKNPLQIPNTLRAMAGLQARLHTVPIDGCPLAHDSPLVDRWLDRPRANVLKYRPDDLVEALAWLDEKSHLVREEEAVVTHNDFHPLNLIADGDRLTLLDWSDADLGDRHCDVARTLALFWLAPPLAESIVERTVLRFLRGYVVSRYRREYETHHRLDDDRLRYWEALHAFQAWSQIAIIHGEGEAALGARAGVGGQIPKGLVPALRTYFRERTC